jgi:hypothetical protein
MTDHSTRFAAAVAAIDAANARDPNQVEVAGLREPAELVYGRRMSAALARLAPQASEPLRIAARGQHIERWQTPRTGYPAGRAGYLTWRRDLKDFHARRVGQIMAALEFPATDIARVASLIQKERLKADPEAQTLEDTACVVFLEHYISAFAAKTEDAKLADILAKTWDKMSAAGHLRALELDLSPKIVRLLERGRERRLAARGDGRAAPRTIPKP